MSRSRPTPDAFTHLFQGEPSDGCRAFADIATLCTAQGRRAENQDRAFAAMLPGDDLNPVTFIAALFDGMGGMRGGGEAAARAASAFLSSLSSSPLVGLADRLAAALEAANAAVWSRFRGAGGSTLTALAIDAAGEAQCVHVGDSRAYARSQEANQITTDDTIAGLLGEQGSGFDDGLTQFVGASEDVLGQAYDLKGLGATAFLLTSDGFHSLPWRETSLMFRFAENHAENLAKHLKLDDNATVIVIDIERARSIVAGFVAARAQCVSLTAARGGQPASQPHGA